MVNNAAIGNSGRLAPRPPNLNYSARDYSAPNSLTMQRNKRNCRLGRLARRDASFPEKTIINDFFKHYRDNLRKKH